MLSFIVDAQSIFVEKNEPNQYIAKYDGQMFLVIDFFSACITDSMSMDTVSTLLVSEYNAHKNPQ